MTAVRRLGWVGLAAVALGLGCQGDPLEREQDIAGWATSSSALGVFNWGYEPLAYADGELSFADPACPKVSDNGTRVLIEGDCTDDNGKRFAGVARVERSSGGVRVIELDGYGSNNDPDFILNADGTVTVIPQDDGTTRFEIGLKAEALSRTEVTYVGTVEGNYGERTVWNGAGTIYREGLTFNDGTVQAITEDQVRDLGMCNNQPSSGSTTLKSDEHTVVVTYDGASDCDEDRGAQWSRDGKDRGTLKNVGCAASGGRARPLALGLFLALLVIGRRRRRA